MAKSQFMKLLDRKAEITIGIKRMEARIESLKAEHLKLENEIEAVTDDACCTKALYTGINCAVCSNNHRGVEWSGPDTYTNVVQDHPFFTMTRLYGGTR